MLFMFNTLIMLVLCIIQVKGTLAGNGTVHNKVVLNVQFRLMVKVHIWDFSDLNEKQYAENAYLKYIKNFIVALQCITNAGKLYSVVVLLQVIIIEDRKWNAMI